MSSLKLYVNQSFRLSEPVLEKFCSLFHFQDLRKGEFLIRAGEESTKFGFLDDGVIRAFYRNEKGTEYNKHFFIGPEFIGGYASLVTGEPSLIYQQALTDCRIFLADYQELERLYSEFHELEHAGRMYAERSFALKEKRELELVLLDAESRYAHFLDRYAFLETLIPQYHIASFLGITPTQLSRIRKKRLLG